MIALRLQGPDDVAELIEALVLAADACEDQAPALAARRRAFADALGDGLDALPSPTLREDT